ncbi:MAG: YqaJ viral recombinase family protein [Dechloromonas sp.]|nr:YqaJ viral recombinase family protein [Dechloromonas sp.]
MSKILTLIQGTDEWHKHRMLYRNASEAAAVMGVSPWLTPYQLWEIKTGRRSQEANFAMRRGTELEPVARAAYELARGYIMEPLVMVSGDYSASLDGSSLPGDLILEVKCPVKGRESETWKEAEAGRIQAHYYWQVQHQLMVSGAAKADFYVFDGEDGVVVEVLPNQQDIEQLRLAWDDFWVFIRTDSPPPLTSADTVIREDSLWQSAAEDYIAQKQVAEAATKAVEQAKAKLTDLAQHNNERGFGVSVCKFWRGNSGKQEVRVTLLKQAA